jgi:hypothetical protein
MRARKQLIDLGPKAATLEGVVGNRQLRATMPTP